MIKIVIDSVSAITQKEAKKKNYGYIPLSLFHGEKRFLDGVEISQNEILDLQKKGEKLSTSQPAIGLIEKILEKESKANKKVIVLTCSSTISGTYSNTYQVAQNFPNVTVIDTKLGGAAIIAMADKVKGMLKNDSVRKVVKELKKWIGNMPLYMFCDDVKYLVNSGRVKPVIGKMAKVAGIKPIMKFNKGVIEKCGIARNWEKMILKSYQDCKNSLKNFKKIAVMLYGHNKSEEKAILQKVKEIFNMPVVKRDIAATIAINVGPKSVGLSIAEIK